MAARALSVGGPAPPKKKQPFFTSPVSFLSQILRLTQSTRITSPKRDPHNAMTTVSIYHYIRWAAFVPKALLPDVVCCLGAIAATCFGSPFFTRMLGASYGGAMVFSTGKRPQKRGNAKENLIHTMVHLEPSWLPTFPWYMKSIEISRFLFLISPSSGSNNLNLAPFNPSVPAALVEFFQRSKDHVKAGLVQDQSLNTAWYCPVTNHGVSTFQPHANGPHSPLSI